MKKTVYSIFLLLIGFTTFADQIDERTAITVGKTFVGYSTRMALPAGSLQLKLVYKSAAGNNSENAMSKTVYFYVFNILPAKGFVIVAGDDAVMPILGYSGESNFDPEKIPENVARWLEGYKKEIQFIVAKNIPAADAIKNQWLRLTTNSTLYARPASITSVNPLVQTLWDQSPDYNALCPGGSVTGCVATAMAQVMKYWNYPATGTGFHSYNPPNNGYGTLSANFGSTTYQWNAMPLQLTGANTAVATLMYHAGVSVDMNYSPQSSGAYVVSSQSPVTNCAEYALKTYFGYRNTLQGLTRANYTDLQWTALLKTELDAARPIIYAGFGNGGGHCFVNDGYDNNDFFHFNWGWSGQFDGFFQINALNPGGVGTGGGAGGYNSGHQAIVGIQPPVSLPQTYSMQLYNFVTPSASTIGYGQAFTVSANIANAGNGSFTGDYCAAVFDNAGNFIDYVEIKTGFSLAGGYHYINNIVFSSTGIFAMLPASYTVSIFYRPTGGNWSAIANSGSYTNSCAITIINQNYIELNSAISTTPSGSLIVGQPASVNVNIRNDGNTTFTGQYMVNLYNLDGTFAQTIDSLNETNGLAAGYTYLTPFLSFNTQAITAAPGTYLLAVLHTPAGGTTQLSGSYYFQNPVKIIVKAEALQPDVYEVNNTAAQATNATLSFTGNTASLNTEGSNCNINSDVDYYKVVLPAGFNYTISSRLHDSYNSGNGKTYTLDALFSWSTDTTNWSATFDDVMPNNIIISGGQTIYFKVAPFFVGSIGTYLLDIQLTKSPYLFTWTGPVSTDWSNIYNWSTNRIPTAADDIIIPTGTPFTPVITNGVIGTCKSLHVNKGVKLTLQTGGHLKITGH
jgi:hypothetical protein